MLLALAALPAPAGPAAGNAAAAAETPVGGTITLALDATEAQHRILRTRQTIPARPGALTLAYPKWIPGEHGPSGPVVEIVGMTFTAAGRPLAWRRDPADMFLIHLEVPPGAAAVEADLDVVTPVAADGFGAGPSASARLLMLEWNQVLLYPAGPKGDDIRIAPEIRLPEGWRYGTALRTLSGPAKGGDAPAPAAGGVAGAETASGAAGAEAGAGATVRFKPVSLTTLVDSPLLAGAYFRTVALSPQGDPRPAFLHIAADSDAALQAKPEVLDAYRRLVAEAVALFGARHYDEYHFLLALSDHVAWFGLEHHESSDNRIPERGLVDDDKRVLHADLLAHEMVHSWNAKYRRPAGLLTPDYRQPIDSRMLWIYEGLTNYLGVVLAARSGLLTADETRDSLAWVAATYSRRPGRAWRPLEDTGTAAQILYYAPAGWESLRRGVDFYDEGTLVWLEADALIRAKTGGRKSLDDFCRLFHGGADGPPEVKPYTEEDVHAALGKVAANDWRGFFAERVLAINPTPPLAGLDASGWMLGFSDAKTPRLESRQEVDDLTDARFSLGMLLDKTGLVVDALGDTSAARAGLAPGMTIVAVNGRRFSRTVLEDAVRAGAPSIDLLAENGEFFRTHRVEYSAGLRFPRLERREGASDMLGAILAPRTAPGP
jgi:predicted metalloprotease with PDZ domain